LSVGIGYELLLFSEFFKITPLAGLSYHAQNLTMQNGVQVISDYGWPTPLGPFSSLDSSYDAKWYGPWIGLELGWLGWQKNKSTSGLEPLVGIEYHRVDLPPAIHAFRVRFGGFPRTTVPAMILDGERVQGTLDISEALDQAFPERPLFPSDPGQRAKVREAEVWGEKFQRATRRIFYGAARRDRRVFSTFLRRGQLSSAAWLFVRATTPLIIKVASKGHGSTDERVRDDLERLPANLDRIDAWLGDGTLGGEPRNAADYQIAPNVRAMLQFADFVQQLLIAAEKFGARFELAGNECRANKDSAAFCGIYGAVMHFTPRNNDQTV
jgi:glutathione S-transferase